MSHQIVKKLLSLAKIAESRNLDDISAQLAGVIRDVNAGTLITSAKDSGIEIESWPDFLNWWNNNRGQNLVYIFMDTYGGDSEQVRLVKKLVKEADKHEKDLHEFYLKLRDLAGPAAGPEGGPDATGAPDMTGGDGSSIEEVPTELAEENSLDELALELG